MQRGHQASRHEVEDLGGTEGNLLDDLAGTTNEQQEDTSVYSAETVSCHFDPA